MTKLDSIEILGRRWSIKRTKRLVYGGTVCDGVTIPDTFTIKIRSGLKDDAFAATLFHELCHAALFMTGQSQMLSDEQEEAIVRAIEHGLAPHLKLLCLEVPTNEI